MKHSYRFFENRDCEYFPCHPVQEGADFNCLFCFCPLYALKRQCGGNYSCNESGVKDCSCCLWPHDPAHYEEMMQRLRELIEMVRE
jgi:Zn-finger protein